MKSNFLFLGIAFFTVSFWQFSYYKVAEHFSGMNEVKQEVVSLEKQLQLAQAKITLGEYRLESFKEEVSQVLPQHFKQIVTPEEVQRRDLASVVRAGEDEGLKQVMAAQKINTAVKYFDLGDFEKSSQLAGEIVKGNFVTSYLPRAKFILAESYFRLEKYEECLVEVKSMIELFPENEMTGYLLLRMGQIFRVQNRADEASEIFEVVAKSFNEENLKKRAEALKKDLGSYVVE